MKSHVSKEEMKKRNDKDILAEKEMMAEGGAVSESYKNDPRINKDKNQKKINKNKKDPS